MLPIEVVTVTTEQNHGYRGVLCIHCRQPIPLSDTAARTNRHLRGQEKSTDTVVQTFTLRCRVCHLEGLYMPLDVVDCDGIPKARHRCTSQIQNLATY